MATRFLWSVVTVALPDMFPWDLEDLLVAGQGTAELHWLRLISPVEIELNCSGRAQRGIAILAYEGFLKWGYPKMDAL